MSVSEHDLHAYVDGRLDESRRSEIERWLAQHPDAAAEVAGWRQQNDRIRALFSVDAPHADDARRIAGIARSRRAVRLPPGTGAAAAAVALFLLGAAAGVLGTLGLATAPSGVAAVEVLPAAARASYLVYTREVAHPVEVGADEEAHLVSWLGKRLGTEIAAPDLSAEGFRLVGGRLVPFRGAPGALLMYEDASGERLTLLFGRNEDNSDTGFRFASEDRVQTFYWIDGPVGYALSGEVGRERLERISRLVYRQL